jgi:hypothetical protein
LAVRVRAPRVEAVQVTAFVHADQAPLMPLVRALLADEIPLPLVDL